MSPASGERWTPIRWVGGSDEERVQSDGRRSSRFEQANVQVVLPVGLGQRAGDGDGFCIPGIPVPASRTPPRA